MEHFSISQFSFRTMISLLCLLWFTLTILISLILQQEATAFSEKAPKSHCQRPPQQQTADTVKRPASENSGEFRATYTSQETKKSAKIE